MEEYDLIIIGAGAAGISAGIYAVRSGLKTLILDEGFTGGILSKVPTIVNYPGFAEIKGGELAERMALQCKKIGASIHELETVNSLDLKQEKKIVKTSHSTFEAKAVIIASGAHYREINVKGEKEFLGRGVSYCGVCDGPFFKSKRVLVVGGGNSACATTLYLSGIASQVFVVHRRESFRAEEAVVKEILSKSNVTVFWNTEVKEIKGEKTVTSVTLYDNKTGNVQELNVDGVFVQVGESPKSQLAQEASVEVDEEGRIKIDMHQRTNLSGVYAAGDVTNYPVRQIGTAVGQGIVAALDAYSFIRRPYYRKQEKP